MNRWIMYSTFNYSQPIALIYRDPVACKGCPESKAALLQDNYTIVYAGLQGEEVDVSEKACPQLTGTCIGGYLTGTGPRYGLFSSHGHINQYITSKGAFITTENDTVVPLFWRGQFRHIYFQDRAPFEIDWQAAPRENLAYYTNGKIAASVQYFGAGHVGMVGPHPEADEGWYREYHLNNPDEKLSFDL